MTMKYKPLYNEYNACHNEDVVQAETEIKKQFEILVEKGYNPRDIYNVLTMTIGALSAQNVMLHAFEKHKETKS